MLVNAMATKKKGSKSRTPSKKKPAAKKRGAAKKPVALKKSAAPKKRASSKKAAAPRRPVAAKKAGAKKSARPSTHSAKKAKKPSAPVAKATPIRRRDGAGHLDAEYAKMLREKSREGRVRDSDEAFIGRSGRSKDNLAEAMGETWVETATSGEDENEDVFNQSVPEDEGGPFVGTTAGQEFAEGTDASNPKQSKREPFPKT
jgi:hypothetical protein